MIVKRDCLAENFWVAIERALPKPIANHHHRWRPNFVFLFAKRSPDLRRQSDDVKKVSCNRRARNALRVASRNSTEISRFLMSRGEMFKNGVVLLPIKIIRERDRIILSRSGRFVKDHDPVRIRVRKRTKQDRVDDAKDRGVGSNTQSKRDNHNKREPRRFTQLAKSKLEIVHVVTAIIQSEVQ